MSGEGSLEGTLEIGKYKKLTITFNCLGTNGKTTMVLHINTPFYKPIDIVIDKRCVKETLLSRIAEKIATGEDKYGIIGILAVCIIIAMVVYAIMTCCNLCRGKRLVEAVPCGRRLIMIFIGSGEISTPEVIESTAINDNELEREDKYGSL